MGPVKLPFADSDLAPLTKRYSSSTIVTMLREIAKCKTAKLDWGVLCKGTATGITNPREYQAVWRSIAYHADLDESFDGHESPLEDDSDIDVDLDPVPSVNPAVAESLFTFVKADLHQHELEEARLEQNAAVQTTTVDIPAAARPQQQVQHSVGEQPAAAVTAALACSTSKAAYSGAGGGGGGAMNTQAQDRKRRRLWTPEEDLALIAAVDKCGEGNWTTVLKNHYDFDRSASQLSQRWALIRKRREVQEKAGYGGSGVSLLATGYKDVRPEGLKSGPLPASVSQVGTSKDVANKSTSVPMPIKQPLSSTPPVPVSKRLPVAAASTPMATETTTPISVLETQRVRALPTSGVSSSWAGAPAQQQQRPQVHMRAPGASQALHKGAIPERRPGAQGSSQMFYTSTQSATPTVPIDSKYAASRNMGAGVARGGSKPGVHGPDPMIQAAAMAAGARIAPASTAASLLKAAQSGNVVHIGSGGLPRSKLGQAGSVNAGGSPGIVHYIRTGSGGASLATSSSGLQRTSSHHMQKAQSNQPNRGPGNSSPLSAPSVPPQASRNSSQAPSKQVSASKRGSSPQQKTSPSTPAPTPPAPTPVGILSQTSVATPGRTSPAQSSTPTPGPSSVSTPPAPAPSPVSTPAPPTSVATPLSSTLTPAPLSVSTPAAPPPSVAISVARPATIIASSIATSIASSIASSAPKSTPAAPPSTPAPKVTPAAPPAPKVTPAAPPPPKVTPAAPPPPKVTPAVPPSTSGSKSSVPSSTSAAKMITAAAPSSTAAATSASKSASTCGFNTVEAVASEEAVATP